jgi:hypothetical protein
MRSIFHQARYRGLAATFPLSSSRRSRSPRRTRRRISVSAVASLAPVDSLRLPRLRLTLSPSAAADVGSSSHFPLSAFPIFRFSSSSAVTFHQPPFTRYSASGAPVSAFPFFPSLLFTSDSQPVTAASPPAFSFCLPRPTRLALRAAFGRLPRAAFRAGGQHFPKPLPSLNRIEIRACHSCCRFRHRNTSLR